MINFDVGMVGNPRQLDTEWCLESSLYKVSGKESERSESGCWWECIRYMKDIYRDYIGYLSSRIYEAYERDSRGCGIWVYRVERFIEEMGVDMPDDVRKVKMGEFYDRWQEWCATRFSERLDELAIRAGIRNGTLGGG
jgi:hypothetical protein